MELRHLRYFVALVEEPHDDVRERRLDAGRPRLRLVDPDTAAPPVGFGVVNRPEAGLIGIRAHLRAVA
jgi:hypothetical protein